MKRPKKARLVSVDGIDAAAVVAVARRALGGRGRGGVSHWDASGIFQDLDVAEAEAGTPSARTLLLLYAADLAFRLRWEIRPSLAAGRTVVAAPYVDTAVAFGRAAGLPAGWLTNLFRFAPPAANRMFVASAAKSAGSDGFVGFASDRIFGINKRTRRHLVSNTAAHLRAAAHRHSRRKNKKTAKSEETL